MNRSMQHHRKSLGAGILQEIRRRVPPPFSVEDCPSDLRPDQMIVRKAIVRANSGLQQSIPHRRLPLLHRRLKRHQLLHPLVRLVDQPAVPPHGRHVLGGCACVEPGVDATAAAQNAGPGVDHAVFRHEALRRGGGGEVGEGPAEGGEVGDVGVAVGRAAALEEEHGGVLGERGGEWAAGGAAADDDVVVVGDRWS